MVLMPLTDRQQEIYSFIREQITRGGAPPTLREIGDRFGITSTNGVRAALDALARKGYIVRSPLRSRGIELTEEVRPPEVRVIPLVGRVAAGTPLLAVENIDDHFALDKSLLPAGDLFTLKVQGESMRDAGILDGDYVFVKKQETARSGEMVVALVGDEATVKWFRPGKSSVVLAPDNPDFEPIEVTRQSPEFRIAGKVVGVLRRFE
jgi:repressor LexA